MSGTTAVGAVPFAYTPSNLLVPMLSLEMNNSQANFDVATMVGLLVGQPTIAQSVVPSCIFSTTQGINMYGAGSVLARMIEKWLANDTLGYVWCLPVPDASAGTAATGTLTISASSAQAGTIPLYIGGRNVPAAVSAGDTSTAIATNVAAAINALPNLAVTASATTNVVTLTAKNKGTLGKGIDIRLAYYGTLASEALPSGVAIAITAMTGGTQDPDLTVVNAAIGGVAYDFIVSPYSSPAETAVTTPIMSASTGRWGPLRKIFGHIWSAVVGNYAAVDAITVALNDAHLTMFGAEPQPCPAEEVAAAITGACAPPIRVQPNAGLQGVQVQGLLAPAAADRFSEPQQQALLSSGCATCYYDEAGGYYVQRAVTTYQFNAYGQADQSYLDAPTLYGLMVGNRLIISDLTSKLANFLIFEDGVTVPAGVKGITPTGIKAMLAGSYQLGIDEGLYQDVTTMLANTRVQINDNNPGRVDILFAPVLVYGLYNTAILNQFRFVTGAGVTGTTAAAA